MYLTNQLKITDNEIISVSYSFFFFSFLFFQSNFLPVPASFRMSWEQQYSQTLTNSFFSSLMFFIARQSAISGHLALTPLIPAWENHSCKRPTLLVDVRLQEPFHCTGFWVLLPLYTNYNAVYWLKEFYKLSTGKIPRCWNRTKWPKTKQRVVQTKLGAMTARYLVCFVFKAFWFD